LHTICDPKTRLIGAPAVQDRVLHHALLAEVGHVFERRFIDQSFAAGRGRGPLRAVLYFLKCQRDYAWRLHLDIKSYFPSVSHETLRSLFASRITDRDTLELVRLIVESGNSVYASALARRTLGENCPPSGFGLPLGSWFSQWCGNFYLDAMDHYIKRELKVRGHLRYMDDFVLYAESKSLLTDARDAIAAWLATHRGLRLNPKHLAVAPTRSPASAYPSPKSCCTGNSKRKNNSNSSCLRRLAPIDSVPHEHSSLQS
jgi:retron-type reverse transcriptase